MDTLNDDEDYKEASGVEWIKTETVSLIIISTLVFSKTKNIFL